MGEGLCKRPYQTRNNLRFGPEPELEADSCLLRSSALTSLHKHFECTLLVFLSSRHLSHCDTGRPLRLISKSGRSVWLHEEVRCPLMQDSLVRDSLSVAWRGDVGKGRESHHANFLPLMLTCWEVSEGERVRAVERNRPCLVHLQRGRGRLGKM